ncbi:TMEM175 family protein [Leifsonia sp. LS-T14]|uniref:TMEM175 family protein n=1 Tax=unclassified Leifsonia TaxID=2663824 RepID=UPI0035A68E01
MKLSRLEAFSDGVLAVAITLLVLDLHVTPDSKLSLAQQLADEWPSFAAYALSFFVIGVIWVNHHAVTELVARVDRRLMFYNLLLLLFVSTIPFTTSTLASFLEHDDQDSRVAALLYGASMEGMAISFTLILAHIIHGGLMKSPVTREEGRRAILRFGAGVVVYPLIVVVGLFSAPLMLALYAVLTGFYIVNQTPVIPEAAAQKGSDPR